MFGLQNDPLEKLRKLVLASCVSLLLGQVEEVKSITSSITPPTDLYLLAHMGVPSIRSVEVTG